MATTQVTRLAYAAAQNTDPIFCEDPAAQAKGTTDFCFDFCTPVQWDGALPTPGQPQPAVNEFVNLALDVSPVLGRDQAVMLRKFEGGGDPWPADSRGFRGGSRAGAAVYSVSKSGLAEGLVLNPKSEGFRDFYVDLWFILLSNTVDTDRGLFGRGVGVDIDYGIGFNNENRPREWFTGALGPVAGLGTLMHIGHHLSFDTAADTAQSRLFANGAEVGEAMPHRKPSEWVENSRLMIFNRLGGYGSADAIFPRLSRTFTNWPGETLLDPLKLHQDEERFNRPRLA